MAACKASQRKAATMAGPCKGPRQRVRVPCCFGKVPRPLAVSRGGLARRPKGRMSRGMFLRLRRLRRIRRYMEEQRGSSAADHRAGTARPPAPLVEQRREALAPTVPRSACGPRRRQRRRRQAAHAARSVPLFEAQGAEYKGTRRSTYPYPPHPRTHPSPPTYLACTAAEALMPRPFS